MLSDLDKTVASIRAWTIPHFRQVRPQFTGGHTEATRKCITSALVRLLLNAPSFQVILEPVGVMGTTRGLRSTTSESFQST